MAKKSLPVSIRKRKQPFSLESKFWKHVEKTDACWLWHGVVTKSGYGQLGHMHKVLKAHRVSFYLHNGHWPKGIVMHACDNKLCVNPSHLSDGTTQENTQQAVERGLTARGSKQGSSKLTEAEVATIKQRIRSGDKDMSIAHDYGVSRECIQMIRAGRNWKHVD